MPYYIDKNYDDITIAEAADVCGWTKCDSDSGHKKLSLKKAVCVRRFAYAKRNGIQDRIFAERVGFETIKFSLMPDFLETKEGYIFNVGIAL